MTAALSAFRVLYTRIYIRIVYLHWNEHTKVYWKMNFSSCDFFSLCSFSFCCCCCCCFIAATASSSSSFLFVLVFALLARNTFAYDFFFSRMVGKEFRSNYSQILWISRLFLCDGLLFSYCMKTLLVKKHFSSVELTDFFFSLIHSKSDAKINTTRVLIFVWKKLLFLLYFFFPLFRICAI